MWIRPPRPPVRRLAPLLLACALATPLGGCRGVDPDGAPPEGRTVPTTAPSGWVVGPQGLLRIDDGGPAATGTAAPVVLVHGLGGHRNLWTSQLWHLRKQRRAVAIDLRGHGSSAPAANGSYRVEELAADVKAALDGLAIHRAILVGHSMGASVVTALAAEVPDRVAGLVLLDPVGDFTQLDAEGRQSFRDSASADEVLPRMERLFAALLGPAGKPVREQVLSALHLADREAVIGCLKGLLDYRAAATLRSYRGSKTVVVTEGKDEAWSLPRLLPELPVRRFAGAGHWLMLDQPDRVNALLDDLLRGV